MDSAVGCGAQADEMGSSAASGCMVPDGGLAWGPAAAASGGARASSPNTGVSRVAMHAASGAVGSPAGGVQELAEGAAGVLAAQRSALDVLASAKDMTPEQATMHHGGSFGAYMALKNTKLREQFEANSMLSARQSDIFAGVGIFVNGHTYPSALVRARQARQGSARAGQARQGSARAGQARQGQDRPGQGREGRGRQGQGRQGRGRQGQARAGQGRAGQGRPGQARPGQARPGQARPGQARPGQARAGQARAGRLHAVCIFEPNPASCTLNRQYSTATASPLAFSIACMGQGLSRPCTWTSYCFTCDNSPV
eukprot:365471-Chlamydomonas_euryale.AAC.3